MEEKRALAILGSPHKEGHTAAMLERAVYQAERAGYTVSRVNLYEKNIGFCRGCEACYKTQNCVIDDVDDDMQEIIAGLRECRLVILAAPVYWANVPGPIKNMFDRLLGVAMEKTRTFPKPRLGGRKYIILTYCHTPAPFSWLFGQSRGAIRSIDEVFKTAGMRPMAKIVYAGAKKNGELPEGVIRKIERLFK